MRNLIRENADYWDRMGFKNEFGNWGGSTTTRSTPTDNPKCKAEGCDNKVNKKRGKGKGYWSYCPAHKDQEAQPKAEQQSTGGSSNESASSSSSRTSNPSTVMEASAPKGKIHGATRPYQQPTRS